MINRICSSLIIFVFVMSLAIPAFAHTDWPHTHYFDRIINTFEGGINKGIVVSKYNGTSSVANVSFQITHGIRNGWTFNGGFKASVVSVGTSITNWDWQTKNWKATCSIPSGYTCFIGLVEIYDVFDFTGHTDYTTTTIFGAGWAREFKRHHFYQCKVQGNTTQPPNPCGGWNPYGGIEDPDPATDPYKPDPI